MIPPVSAAPANSDPVLATNKALVSRLFLEIVNGHAYDVADEIFAPDFRWPQLGITGSEGVKAWARAFHTGFPDAHDRIDWQIAEGPWVASVVTVSGTNTGPWLGFPPSGRFAQWSAIGLDRVADGRIVERAALFNLADVMRQMGSLTLPI